MSAFDKAFKQNCQTILSSGYDDFELNVRPKWEDGSPAHTLKAFGLVNRYDLSQEFPMLTIRKFYYEHCIDELLWIWQKKSNRLADLNSHIWDAWGLSDGTIGKAYGYQLAQKHQYKEGKFDQVERVIYELQHNKASRRMIVNMYNHADLQEMALYPCAYNINFNVTGNKLNAVLNQRSNDMLTANHWNVMQYALLVHMLAQVTGLKVGELVHVIVDAHIYDRHIEIVKELLKRPEYPAPKLEIDPDVKRFEDFTVKSFAFKDYKYGEPLKNIPVAV